MEQTLANSHPRAPTLPPSQVVEFQWNSRLSGNESTGRKAEIVCYLETGKRKGQTVLFLLSLRRDFQPGYVAVSWSSVAKGESPHKRDKIILFKFKM